MGLREAIASAVKSGFTALGNVKETVTYKTYQSTSSYDTTTGTVTRTETSTTLSGVFMSYTKREIDNAAVAPHDQKFLCQQADLATTPTLEDRLVRSNGTSWEVVWVKEDPAHVTWELQVRAISG